jgi:hypothetical protein
MGSTNERVEYDALIIGAGFGGYSMLPRYVLSWGRPTRILDKDKTTQIGTSSETIRKRVRTWRSLVNKQSPIKIK